MVDVLNPSFTTGTQWFERTLDDSANKRVAMAEGFLATDAILNIMLNVTDGLVVYPKVVRSRLMAGLWPDPRGDRGRACAGELCGPCTPAGGGVHRQRPAAHLRC